MLLLVVGPGCLQWADVVHTDWREPMSIVSFVERLELKKMQKTDVTDAVYLNLHVHINHPTTNHPMMFFFLMIYLND